MKTNKGLTLVELLVVIAIIGVLAAVVLTFLGSANNRGNDSKIQSQLKSMANQAQLFSGTMVAVSPTVTTVSAFTGTPGGNIFTDTTGTNKSLYLFISKLPSATVIYYGSEAKAPFLGGKWAFAASTTSGSYCIDHTGTGKIGPTIMTAANAATLYPNIANSTFSCN